MIIQQQQYDYNTSVVSVHRVFESVVVAYQPSKKGKKITNLYHKECVHMCNVQWPFSTEREMLP